MSKNIDQVYATNPITTIVGADLVYLGVNGVDGAAKVSVLNTTVSPTGNFFGFNLIYSNVNNATQFTLTSGKCSDSTGNYSITLSVNRTQDITNSGGINSLDTGNFALSSLYAVYIISDSTGANPTGGISSLNLSAPLLPSGYDIYRRVGYFYTSSTAGSVIYYFTQTGNANLKDYLFSFYNDKIILSAGTATNQTSIGTLSNFVPNTIGSVKLLTTLISLTATDFAYLIPHGGSIGLNYYTHKLGVGAISGGVIDNIEIIPGASFGIDYQIDHNGVPNSSLTIGIVGFRDVV